MVVVLLLLLLLLQEGAPQQQNGFDCGVFLCQMAECISDGRAFDFEQSDIANIRLKMVSWAYIPNATKQITVPLEFIERRLNCFC